MLYKNDEPYKLAPNDLATIKKRFHDKWPLKIVYTPERIVKSRSPQNKLPDKPNSMSWPLTSVVRSESGTEQWRYAENVTIKEHGVKKFTPRNFRFTGNLSFNRTDIELVWFLYTKSEYCRGGLNQGRTIKFMFEDLINDAEVKAEKESLAAQVKALIYGKDFGLSEERLRALAKAYFIKGVDELTFAQVKIAIEHAIMRDPKEGYTKFVEMTDMNELIAARSKIQNMVDMGFLLFDATKKEWIWLDGEKKPDRICKVPPAMSASDAIYDYYMGNKDFQETVDLAAKTKKASVE